MSFLARTILKTVNYSFPRFTFVPISTNRSIFTSNNNCKTFEPDYLDTEANDIPTYPPLNIQIKGYNYDVLEQFQSWIHRFSENMGIDVANSWASPAKTLALTTFQEGGIHPKDTFNVNLYERNVQVVNLRSVDAPILIDCIQRAIPEGVEFTLHEHSVEAEESRWIADPFIDQLRSELSQGQEELEHEKAKRALLADAKAARKKEMLLKSILDDE